MVAKRQKQQRYQTEAEAARAALAKVPTSDEDPALFWGPNWEEEWERARIERESQPREVYYSLDEFFASLDESDE
jgi:hypothetical protein